MGKAAVLQNGPSSEPMLRQSFCRDSGRIDSHDTQPCFFIYFPDCKSQPLRWFQRIFQPTIFRFSAALLEVPESEPITIKHVDIFVLWKRLMQLDKKISRAEIHMIQLHTCIVPFHQRVQE